ncbi:MAG: AAA family ATPase [Candidatus Aenigmarchaeota archaeon]|nr:AAA family ATPase [Candidatus Aenigmarchaeota archaeon]
MRIMDMLLAEQTLFRNEEVFNPEYVPEEILYRDAQIRELMLSIKPSLRGGKAGNCFLIGPPSTGKTTCTKLVLSEIKDMKKIIPAYINCQIYDTPFKIFSEIHRRIFGFSPPETGVPLSAVYDKIFSHISKEKKVLVAALDEAACLFSKDNSNGVFYKILRAYETYPEAKTCLWVISTKDEMHRLDDKVRSVFMPNIIRFQKYSAKEMKEILKRRCEEGLYKGVVTDGIIESIYDNANDLRHAIELARKAVLAAENEGSKRVTVQHVENIIKNIMPEKEIADDERIIIEALKKGSMDAGELFSSVKNKMSYSKFYRILKKMESDGMVEMKSATKGRGKTTVIKLTER